MGLFPGLVGHNKTWTLITTTGADPFTTQAPSPSVKSRSTNSEETWTTIKTWLSLCDASHTKCQTPKTDGRPQWFPSRLLEAFGSLSHVRLLTRDEAAVGATYATLSHRWSATEPITLTTKNVDEFRKGIPMSSLPQTFQDSFLAAKGLGVRYLWIDSLCIVQDSPGEVDWLQESAQMDKVYSEAYLNLSADWRPKDKGLFSDREPLWYKRLQVGMIIPPRRVNDIKISGWYDFSAVNASSWHQQVSLSPLSERGWVFQERVLARRVVHFGCREVLWECRETTLSESFPHAPIPDEIDQVAAHRTLKSFQPQDSWAMRTWREEPASIPSDFTYLVWYDIVTGYSRCELTRGSDKLVAVSGIAKHMKALLNDTYVLGMWKKFLAGELLWRPGMTNSKRRPYAEWIQNRGYRAPTFSWASMDGDIIPGQPLTRGLLVRVQCIPYRPYRQGGGSQQDRDLLARSDKPLDPQPSNIENIFGPVSGPTIEIRVTGFMRRMRLRLGPERREMRWFIRRWMMDDSTSDSDAAEASLDFETTWSDRTAIETETFYYICWDKYRLPPPGNDFFGDLMLLHLDDADMGRFRRFGTSLLWSAKEEHQKMDGVMDRYLEPEEDADTLPCGSYDAESGMHTVFLV